MNKIYLSIGSNVGDRKHYLEESIRLININVGRVTQKSSVYETAGWGITDQPMFLNQVIELETTRLPQEILRIIQKIEFSLGKRKELKWGPRNIDIDILYYGNEIVNEEDLTVPHPHIQDRRFILEPMNEIASDWEDPAHNMTIKEMTINCADQSYVHPLNQVSVE